MPKASELTLDKGISFLFKSPPGFGKTLAACSFALYGPTFLAYFDKKKPIEIISYFKRFGAKGRLILDNIEWQSYGASNANEYLNKVYALQDDCRIDTFITDSVTTLTASAVNWSLGFRPNAKRDKKTVEIPDFDEYKTETSFVTQALDIQKTFPCNVIWTAHPLPGIKIEGSGSTMRVTKTNPIVTYGSKVAGIIPGSFTEIYHFAQKSDWTPEKGASGKKYVCMLDSEGEEFAKSPLMGYSIKEIDFTDRLFAEVWKEHLDQVLEIPKTDAMTNSLTEVSEVTGIINPFANEQKKW